MAPGSTGVRGAVGLFAGGLVDALGKVHIVRPLSAERQLFNMLRLCWTAAAPFTTHAPAPRRRYG
jgi:hypothetical protein